jgi:serine protease Do
MGAWKLIAVVAISLAITLGYDNFIKPASIATMAPVNSAGVVMIINEVKSVTDPAASPNATPPEQIIPQDPGAPNAPTPKSEGGTGLGTGFFIDDNLIVTNNHVIDNSNKLSVKGETTDKLYDAEVIAADPVSDIAIIKIKDWEDYKATNKWKKLHWGDSSRLSVGAKVWSIGHPWGLEWSVSEGILSSKSRRLDPNLTYFLQTDAHIFQGNSGGPLFDLSGSVVGVNSRMISKTGGSFGFTIPSDLAEREVFDLVKFKTVKWASMGVQIKLSDDMKNVVIQSVIQNSAAEKAGLKANDVLLSIITPHTDGAAGRHIYTTEDLLNEMALVEPGTIISIQYSRDKVENLVKVTPDTKLSSDFEKKQP